MTNIPNLEGKFRSDIPARFNELNALEQHYLRFLATKEGAIVPPYEVLIHPSSICNLACAWCIGEHVPVSNEPDALNISTKFKEQGRLPDTMANPEAMLRVIDDILSYTMTVEVAGGHREFRVENVSFSGLIGEPLVAKKAVTAAMRRLADNNRRVGIFTNGLLIDDSVMEVLMGIAYVHISVDAGTPETYANLKARNCTKLSELPKAWKVIEAIAERKRNTGSGLDINCSYIMYPENFRKIYEAAKALKGCGGEILRIKQDNSGNRLLSQNEAAEAEFLLQRIQAELVDDGFKVVTLHKLGMTSAPVRQFSKCRITELMAAVGSDGCLYPCNYHPRPNGASYGSAIELGFKEVWESSVRSMMKKQIPSICPAVCDPFKGRANNLLEIADREVDRLGHVEFLDQVHSIVNK